MNQYKKIAIFIVVMCLTGCCFPAPWKAWRYDHTYTFDGYPSPWNMPDPEKYTPLYVDGAFVNVRVMAHNETTHSGGPPYQLIVPILSKNTDHKSVTFHSIVISSTLGSVHTVSPINVNDAAKKIENLQFPVTKEFESYSHAVRKPTSSVKQFSKASLWSDENLEFQPKEHEVITIFIDIEVHRTASSERNVVEYEFYPRKERGFFQCLSR